MGSYFLPDPGEGQVCGVLCLVHDVGTAMGDEIYWGVRHCGCGCDCGGGSCCSDKVGDVLDDTGELELRLIFEGGWEEGGYERDGEG